MGREKEFFSNQFLNTITMSGELKAILRDRGIKEKKVRIFKIDMKKVLFLLIIFKLG